MQQIAELINGHMTTKMKLNLEKKSATTSSEVKADSNTIEKNVTDIINIQNA